MDGAHWRRLMAQPHQRPANQPTGSDPRLRLQMAKRSLRLWPRYQYCQRSLMQRLLVSFVNLTIAAFVGFVVSSVTMQPLALAQPAIPTLPPPDGRLHDARFDATATRLQNGQVLIAGGIAMDTTASSVAEL